MINTTLDRIVFNVTGPDLSRKVRSALALAAKTHLKLAGLEGVSLDSIGTKRFIQGTFGKFVNGRVLRDRGRQFDEEYVQRALDAYKTFTGYLSKELFDTLMVADEHGPYSYKRSYANSLKPGLGLFLIALHSEGVITLPYDFSWPWLTIPGGRRRMEIGRYVASELLGFIRNLCFHDEWSKHPAFDAIGPEKKRREWFLAYATRLITVCGWHKPEDINTSDMLAIKATERELGGRVTIPYPYKALLDVLNSAFPGRISVNANDWAKACKASSRIERDKEAIYEALSHLFGQGSRNDVDLLEGLADMEAHWGKFDRLEEIDQLPGLNVGLKTLSETWLRVERLFMSKIRRESLKGQNRALGWWNNYLFYYLPYWFDRNPGSSLRFPSTPALLKKTAFVSRLTQEEETPITFVEFINAQASKREWKNNVLYAVLRSLQVFFFFIEAHSDDIPGCKGFVQPLDSYDYPRTSRSRGTSKIPIPRRFFGVLLNYYEALIAHHAVVLQGVVSGAIGEDDLQRLITNQNVIDTFSTSDIVGFVPILIVQNQVIPLQVIPNVLDLHKRQVRGGRTLMLPHPHGLHQNLVALHTGLRHNHIQWLDMDSFDMYVKDGETEFSTLYVNTDKQKSEPWSAHVNFRVIEILRAQKAWHSLIENPAFDKEIFYNENPDTKWPKIRPLFAYSNSGTPHPDVRYSKVWKNVLGGLQGLMPKLRELGYSHKLVGLLPPKFFPDTPDLKNKLIEYGATFTRIGDSCPLRVHALSTPHASRATVVMEYIPFLPADMIGKYITGQTAATVAYYTRLDSQSMEREKVHQVARLREAVINGATEPITNSSQRSTGFVHADSVNSRLAQSLRSNIEATIREHGGVSMTYNEKRKLGVNLLRERGIANVAFNKTEVCPYDNRCPSDIVKELRGERRCSLCPYAVRFIDHLPAILAQKRQLIEAIEDIEQSIDADKKTLNSKYTAAELQEREDERANLCEDLSGWVLNEEVLEVMRQRISSGQDTRRWTVQKPEIIERDLQRIAVQTSEHEYLLARLGECIAFPTMESPQIRARFDLLRRELLARTGRVKEAFSSVATDATLECAGMIKAIVESHNIKVSQVVEILESDAHMVSFPKNENLRLIFADDVG